MKTAPLNHKAGRSGRRHWRGIVLAVLWLCLPLPVPAAWDLSVDGDARFQWTDWAHAGAGIHRVGASLRKTFSDARGDRLVLFGLVEAQDDFSEIMVHELYGLYKGPLGAWNVTAGRFGLPWGLLSGFSASRLLYEVPHDRLLGMDVDSGLKISGVTGALDYAVSITQGYGPHNTPHDWGHGLATARIGFTPGDTEEFSWGLSAAWGRSLAAHVEETTAEMETAGPEHDGERPWRRVLVGLDGTLYLGRWLGRLEAAGGRVGGLTMATGFAALDFALWPRLDLNLAVNAVRHGSDHQEAWFVGFTAKPAWFTFRGGYRYAGHHNESRHEVVFQIYRLFAFSR